MSDYYDYGGGCISGDCSVKLSNGTLVQIKDLRKGDAIWTGDGKYATILCMVQTKIFAFINMVRIGSLIITPYHPIFYRGRWCFPSDVAPI